LGEAMRPNSSGRFFFDITTSMRWAGPPTGIVRVERKLALHARTYNVNLTYVFFDPRRLTFCAITRDAREFLTGEAAVDTLGLTNPALPGRRRTDRIPASLKPAFMWITQTRRMTLKRLEGLRLGTQSPWIAGFADRLQRWLMSGKHRQFMVRKDNTRRPYYPYEMTVGTDIVFERSDTLICVGSGWGHSNIEALSKLKMQVGFRLVLLCYDLIPLMFPQFYHDKDVRCFKNYMDTALAIADHIIVTSRRVADDCCAYCRRHDIAIGKITVCPLGFDIGHCDLHSAANLPAGLCRGQFALLVSTIEPRKGHAMLCAVWRRLVAEGIPQATDFKLVFVGRPGWMVDDLLTQMWEESRNAKQIMVIHDVDDHLLTRLYQAAAFCVYPSQYEGYGLPIIEAFAHGKAVLASTGGAVPEIADGFSPCLDPTDEHAWYKMMKQWIESPQARVPYEREIRTRFRHPNWSEAAENFFTNIFAETSLAAHRRIATTL